MIIAVDFDGTIVEHRYPRIGRELPFAIATLKKLQEERHLLILWSVREGKLLDEAVDFCRKRGLEFYAVNSNIPEDEMQVSAAVGGQNLTGQDALRCRKVTADIYIDDRNIDGLHDWGVLYAMIHNRWTYDRYLQELHRPGRRTEKSFWRRLFGA